MFVKCDIAEKCRALICFIPYKLGTVIETVLPPEIVFFLP
jgi:hypothetical protein